MSHKAASCVDGRSWSHGSLHGHYNGESSFRPAMLTDVAQMFGLRVEDQGLGVCLCTHLAPRLNTPRFNTPRFNTPRLNFFAIPFRCLADV